MLAIFMFVPAFITATITAFLCGILLKLGYVSFITVFLAIVFGDLLSNIFWYMTGRIGGQAFTTVFGKMFGVQQNITQNHLNSSLDVFNKFKDIAVFFVSAPLGMAIMFLSFMEAGLRRLSFWRYVITNTLFGAIWIYIILAMGYGFGYAYVVYSSILSRIGVSFALVIALFLLMTFGGWIRMIIMPNPYKQQTK